MRVKSHLKDLKFWACLWAVASCSNMLHQVEPSSTFYNNVFQLATLKCVARQVEHTVVIRATTRSTCNATMLRDKLNKNVARITGPFPQRRIDSPSSSANERHRSGGWEGGIVNILPGCRRFNFLCFPLLQLTCLTVLIKKRTKRQNDSTWYNKKLNSSYIISLHEPVSNAAVMNFYRVLPASTLGN